MPGVSGKLQASKRLSSSSRSSKTGTQWSAKEEKFVGTACKGNTDAYKSNSPCNHRLLTRRLPPQLVQYTEEELFLLFLIHNQQSSTQQRRATHDMEKRGHFRAGVHGPTEWLRPSRGSARAHEGPAARAHGSFCAGVTSRRCAGALRPCCTAAQALSGPAARAATSPCQGCRASCKPPND